MKADTIKERKYFNIAEFDKEEKYLREMHKQGFKLEEIKGIGKYYFKKCEPEDVVYQLDYNREGAANHEEYVKMFEDCGWEYMFDYFGYSYFRKAATQCDGDESIFCDLESKVEMVKRVISGRLIPLVLLIFAMMVLSVVTDVSSTESVLRIAITNFFRATLSLYGLSVAYVLFAFYRLKKRMHM